MARRAPAVLKAVSGDRAPIPGVSSLTTPRGGGGSPRRSLGPSSAVQLIFTISLPLNLLLPTFVDGTRLTSRLGSRLTLRHRGSRLRATGIAVRDRGFILAPAPGLSESLRRTTGGCIAPGDLAPYPSFDALPVVPRRGRFCTDGTGVGEEWESRSVSILVVRARRAGWHPLMKKKAAPRRRSFVARGTSRSSLQTVSACPCWARVPPSRRCSVPSCRWLPPKPRSFCSGKPEVERAFSLVSFIRFRAGWESPSSTWCAGY